MIPLWISGTRPYSGLQNDIQNARDSVGTGEMKRQAIAPLSSVRLRTSHYRPHSCCVQGAPASFTVPRNPEPAVIGPPPLSKEALCRFHLFIALLRLGIRCRPVRPEVPPGGPLDLFKGAGFDLPDALARDRQFARQDFKRGRAVV